jgi:hypothetical protein
VTGTDGFRRTFPSRDGSLSNEPVHEGVAPHHRSVLASGLSRAGKAPELRVGG